MTTFNLGDMISNMTFDIDGGPDDIGPALVVYEVYWPDLEGETFMFLRQDRAQICAEQERDVQGTVRHRYVF